MPYSSYNVNILPGLLYGEAAPRPIEDGFLCESDGMLYVLAEDFEEAGFLYDLRALYDWINGKKTLLEPAVFRPYEPVHIEGDCDCGRDGL
ncbi:MAG: hypothetical protein NC337_01050 [Roseburia sp.]|nr:hypothetical protein [Roseburia sp.]